MLTPFDHNGAIDYPMLSRLTEYYIESGAGGLFANCLSSEMFELTEAERLSVTEHVIKAAAGAVPVFSTGTFAGTPEQQSDFMKRVYGLGVKAVIVINSVLAGEQEPDQTLDERVFQLIDRTPGVPLGFYECPVPYKRILSAAQLRSYAQTGRVVYYKDTSLSLASIKEKVAAVTDFPTLELYDAYMVNAVASLRAGCTGLSCIQGNYSPELIAWLVEHVDEPACREQVERVQRYLVASMEVMHDVYPVAAKYFLQQKGLPIDTYTRRKVGRLTGLQQQRLDRLAGEQERLLQELNIRTQLPLKSLQ